MKSVIRTANWLAFIVAFAALAGCSAGPEVKSIKQTPGGMQPPEHILVLAINSKEANRAVMESALVARLQASNLKATSYGAAQQMPWEDPQQLRERIKQRLQSENADRVLTVSLVRKNRQVEHIPQHAVFNPVTVSYGPLASATYMETMLVPDTYKETTEYILRTTLFDADSGDSLWQMFSSTIDPKSLEEAAKQYAKVVVRQLNKSFDEGTR